MYRTLIHEPTAAPWVVKARCFKANGLADIERCQRSMASSPVQATGGLEYFIPCDASRSFFAS